MLKIRLLQDNNFKYKSAGPPLQSFDVLKCNDFSSGIIAVHFSELDDRLAFMLNGFIKRITRSMTMIRLPMLIKQLKRFMILINFKQLDRNGRAVIYIVEKI